MMKIEINRPWVTYSLFSDQRVGIKGDNVGAWSKGNRDNKDRDQMCPYIVEGIVVARNINISGIKFTDDLKESMEKLKISGGISYCGFGGASGSYSSEETSSHQKRDKEAGTIS